MFRSIYVDGSDFCLIFFVLCCIHSGPCRTVHDGIRLYLHDCLFHCCRIGDVQRHIRCTGFQCRCNIRTDCLMSALCQFVYHVMSQLSGNACHEYFHIYMPFFISLFSHTFLYSNFDTLRLRCSPTIPYDPDTTGWSGGYHL